MCLRIEFDLRTQKTFSFAKKSRKPMLEFLPRTSGSLCPQWNIEFSYMGLTNPLTYDKRGKHCQTKTHVLLN